MTRIEDLRISRNQRWEAWGRLVQQVLHVPEAVILLGLLVIAWALQFPPMISLLIVMIAAIFGVRLGLIALAERYLAEGAYRRADQFVRAALRLHPWSADALLLSAQGLVQQGQDEAAIEVLRRAIALSPDNHQLQSVLVATLLAQGDIIESWQLADAMNPTGTLSPIALQQLAWIVLHVHNDPARAIALLSRADPEQLPPCIGTPLLITLCNAHIAINAYDKALCLLHRIERQLQACSRTQQAELLYHLGRLYSTLGYDGSSYFRRSVEFDPQGRYAQTAWRCAIHG